MPKKPRALRIFFGAMSATDTMAISRRIPTRSIGPVTFDFILHFGRPGLGPPAYALRSRENASIDLCPEFAAALSATP